MNAELPRSTTLPLVVVIVSSADTVLSVHIRPMFAVLGVSPPRIAAQSFMEDGSTVTVGPTPRMERLLPSSSAKAKLPPKHIRASAKAIASNGRIRFIVDPQSRFRLPENASPDAAEFQHQGISAYRPTHFFRAKKGTSTESSQIPGALVTVVYTNPPSL